MKTNELLLALDEQRKALVANLASKGVATSSNEGLETLVPKVLDISSGGGDIVEDTYNYIQLVESNTNAFFSINLYDYVDDLDDIEMIYVQGNSGSSYAGIYNKHLLGDILVADNVPSNSTSLSNADRIWGSVIIPASQTTYQPLAIYTGASSFTSEYGVTNIAFDKDKNRLYTTASYFKIKPKGIETSTTWSASGSLSSSYKYAVIIYKEKKE
jgi:hypothetical protein